jgi:hypothetical protein
LGERGVGALRLDKHRSQNRRPCSAGPSPLADPFNPAQFEGEGKCPYPKEITIAIVIKKSPGRVDSATSVSLR